MTAKKTKLCSCCNTPFHCDSSGDGKACWCSSLPALMPADFSQDCRCPDCLARAIGDDIQAARQQHSHDEMLKMARPYFDPRQLVEHIDYHIEHGKHLFSAWYHLKRGSCCGNGCRNCPYPKAAKR